MGRVRSLRAFGLAVGRGLEPQRLLQLYCVHAAVWHPGRCELWPREQDATRLDSPQASQFRVEMGTFEPLGYFDRF